MRRPPELRKCVNCGAQIVSAVAMRCRSCSASDLKGRALGPAIRMRVSEWAVDEDGCRSRTVSCADDA